MGPRTPNPPAPAVRPGAAASQLIEVVEGEFVYRAGDDAEAVYVVKDGEIAVEAARDDASVPIAVVRAGGILGEEALSGGVLRGFSARAVRPSRLIRLDRPSFRSIVAARPEVAERMILWFSKALGDVFEERMAVALAVTPGGGVTPPVSSLVEPIGPRLVDVESGATFAVLETGETMVGRADREAKFTPDVDLSSLDTSRSLSRRHARLFVSEGDYYVREEGGVRNGTSVNGRRLTGGEMVRLNSGDEILLGLVRLRFELYKPS